MNFSSSFGVFSFQSQGGLGVFVGTYKVNSTHLKSFNFDLIRLLSEMLKIQIKKWITVAERSKAPDREPRSMVVGLISGHPRNFSTPDFKKSTKSPQSSGVQSPPI